MISFFIALAVLLLGYFIYGKFVEKVFGIDPQRATPATTMADGVDYVPMKPWRIYLIQFLNIAGVGPIIGAIMGAQFGTASFLWIVLGSIFAGAVHDFLSGMLSIRHGGANLPELIGTYLGKTTKGVMLVFSVFLLVMVGVVFVYSPAMLLQKMADIGLVWWIVIIFAYYIVATLLPIDKIIGRFYPIFAFSLIFMALALLVVLLLKWPALPELWDSMSTINNNKPAEILGTESFITKNPVFPCLFLTIACGAISGFHATQSPLMARCLRNERLGRPVFYGSMITEGLVALIWATVSSYFFYYGGWKEVVSPEVVSQFTAQSGAEGGKTLIQFFGNPADVVSIVCNNWLGVLGGILAILGVVAAPITSGDTAFRSARLIIASALKMEQRSYVKRLMICVPMFGASILLLLWQIENPDGFQVIWRYFGWGNQTLSVFTLWTLTVYLAYKKKPFYITLIPALFMTTICSTFIFVSPQFLGLNETLGYILGILCLLIACIWFMWWYQKVKDMPVPEDLQKI